MLIDLIIGVVVGLFTGVLGLLPSYSLPGGGFGGSLGGVLAGLNSLFPMVTLGFCILAVVAFRVMILAVAFVAWVWDKIPFKFS